MARAERTYEIAIKLPDGEIITERQDAEDAACALGVVFDLYFDNIEPDCEWVMVRPGAERPKKKASTKAKPKAAPVDRIKKLADGRRVEALKASKKAEAKATLAVQQLLAKGVDPTLRATGVIEAYAVGIAEGA
jgi:hypothetical protein